MRQTLTVDSPEVVKLRAKLDKLRELFARPGTPAEKQAAGLAMARIESKMLALVPTPKPAPNVKTLADVTQEPSPIDANQRISDPPAFFDGCPCLFYGCYAEDGVEAKIVSQAEIDRLAEGI